MDLDTYALSYDAANAENRSSDSASSDAKGKGKAIDPDTSAAASASHSSNNSPTLASDVQQLTTSLGSWWSGFSKQSADTFAQAQTKFQEAAKNVNEQGGVVEYAKREAKRIEKELEEKRREAKERVQKQEEEDKAKRAKEDEEARQRQAEQPDQAANMGKTRSSIDAGAESGEELFDADQDSTPAASTPSTTATSAASTTATSLFNRLQSLSSDPKVASLQRDVTARIHSLNLFGSSTVAGAANATSDPSAKSAVASDDTLPTIFSDLSKSLSKLSSPETKELAKKYMKASEDVMSKVGEEWRDFMGELVRIVPPEGQQEGAGESATAQEKQKQQSNEGPLSPSSADKDAAVPPATGPSLTATPTADAADRTTQTTTKAAMTAAPTTITPSSAAPASASASTPQDMGPETTSKPPHGADEAGDSDSDWE